MLNALSVKIGTNLADIVTSNNIKLVPKQSTLVLELSRALFNNIFSKINNKNYIESVVLNASLGNNVTNKEITSYIESTHDTIMDNYIEELSKLVSSHISFTRNVVNKEITKLKELVQDALGSYKYKDSEDFFSISYFKLHDVFNSYIIQEEVKSYANSTNKYFYEKMPLDKLKNIENFELSTYILTGDEEQDKVILSWFNTLDKEKALNYIVNDVAEYSLGINTLLDYSLINYLFFRNLFEKNDIDLGLSSLQLKTKSSANRDYYGNKLNIALDTYFKDIRNGKLLTTNSETSFSYFNKDPLNITIYEESFNKLAEEGCSIEVLFGYISSEGKNDITVNKLLANKEKYINNWNNIKSLYLISINNSRLDIFKQILRTQVEATFKEITEAEQEIFTSNTNFNNETKKLVDEYIDDLQLSEIEDIDKICLELVAKIRFRFTNAYYILREMDEILKMSNNVKPIEAALYSSIKYITDFLIEQVDIVKL